MLIKIIDRMERRPRTIPKSDQEPTGLSVLPGKVCQSEKLLEKSFITKSAKMSKREREMLIIALKIFEVLVKIIETRNISKNPTRINPKVPISKL